MAKVIVTGMEGRIEPLYQAYQNAGHQVSILSCFDDPVEDIALRLGANVVPCEAHRHDVSQAVAAGCFDIALIDDGGNCIRTALLVQAMRDAGVGQICVVSSRKRFHSTYRRCGAHIVIDGENEGVSLPEAHRWLVSETARTWPHATAEAFQTPG